jgi:putative phosphoesterase
MRIGIISDTHDHLPNARQAVEIFRRHGVQYVLHAGDIVAPFTARIFSELRDAKFIAVFGNNDGEKLQLKRVVEGFGGEIHEYCYQGELAGRKVCMVHTDHMVEELAASQRHDLVIHGHTHHPETRRVGRTLIINPGEATDALTSLGRVVILDLDDMSPTVEPLG